MSSKILYDKRNNQILRCQQVPFGSAGLPSKEGLCRSARIPEDEKQHMDTVIINDNMLTNQAQREYRIVKTNQQVQEQYQENETDKDGNSYTATKTKTVTKLLPKAIKKPKLIIGVDTQKVIISDNPSFTITVIIADIIDSDSFSSVSTLINDVSFDISVSNNTGTQKITLTDPGKYIIKCDDDRFRSKSITVEAV